MQIFRRIACLLAAALMGAGCVHKSGPPLKEDQEKPAEEYTQPFHLVGLAVDREAVRSGSQRLFDSPPAGEKLGETRRARGYFTLTNNGYCRCEVRAGETVVGLGGQVAEQRYDLVVFFGKLDDDRRLAVAAAGDRSGTSFAGRVSELRLNWLSPTVVEARPVIGGVPQAYVYRFERRSLTSHDVDMPY